MLTSQKQAILVRVQMMLDQWASDRNSLALRGRLDGALAVLRDLTGEKWTASTHYKGVEIPHILNEDDDRVILPTCIAELAKR